MPRYASLPDNYREIFADHWRSKRLVDPIEEYRNPIKLQEACVEYFEWNAQNPINLTEPTNTKASGIVDHKYKAFRTMTLTALCLRIGISQSLWRDWKKECPIRRPVILWAEDVLRAIKLEAASVDMINPMIAVRELGLREGHELTGADGEPLGNQVDPKDVLIEKLTGILDSRRATAPHQPTDDSTG